MANRKKDGDFIAKILEHVGCDKRETKHTTMWFHEERQFKIQIAHTTSDVRSIKNLSATVSRTLKEHFSYEELVLLLEPFTRKRKNSKLMMEGGGSIGWLNTWEII